MKKLEKIRITNYSQLNESEMKNVRGGQVQTPAACTMVSNQCQGGCVQDQAYSNDSSSNRTCQKETSWMGGLKVETCICK